VPKPATALRAMIKPLGLTQADLADAIGLSPAALSKFFAEGGKRQDLSAESFAKLLDAFDAHILRLRELPRDEAGIKAIVAREIAALEEKGDAGREAESRRIEMKYARFLNALTNLNPARLDAFGRQVAAIRAGAPPSDPANDDAPTEAPALRPRTVTPRGPLPVGAVNYLPRDADARIAAILDEHSDPACIVVGPIQGGTSSFLNRVYAEANARPKFLARLADLESEFAGETRLTQVDLFRAMLRRFGVPNETLAGDVHDMKVAFGNWAKAEWAAYERVVLIVDGVDFVFKNAGSVLDAMALINWMAALRNEMARGEAPLNRLILFTAFTGQTWSAAHASTFGTQASELRLGKFTREELNKLADDLGVKLNEQEPRDLYARYHGHPYLSHLALWAHRALAGQDTRATPQAASRDEEAHWLRMMDEITFLVGQSFAVADVLRTVLAKIEGAEFKIVPEIMARIWNNYARSLREFGLIDGDLKTPGLCGFYRTAIGQWLDENSEQVA